MCVGPYLKTADINTGKKKPKLGTNSLKSEHP